jgi:hypothetical protein
VEDIRAGGGGALIEDAPLGLAGFEIVAAGLVTLPNGPGVGFIASLGGGRADPPAEGLLFGTRSGSCIVER